jgi:hypothetical protein
MANRFAGEILLKTTFQNVVLAYEIFIPDAANFSGVHSS